MSADTCAIPGCTGPVRARDWCNKHYRRYLRTGSPAKVSWERGDHIANFWAKVHRRGSDECWLWTGSIVDGYGQFVWPGGQLAHRFSYEQERGPIPPLMELDHLCHSSDRACTDRASCMHRRCVNPRHLEAVTRGENQRRRRDERPGASAQRAKTHCPKGHPYDEANTYVDKRGSRNCRTCHRERTAAADRTDYQRAYYVKRRADS